MGIPTGTFMKRPPDDFTEQQLLDIAKDKYLTDVTFHQAVYQAVNVAMKGNETGDAQFDNEFRERATVAAAVALVVSKSNGGF